MVTFLQIHLDRRKIVYTNPGGVRMSYNVGKCRDCDLIVERNSAGLCYDCWCAADIMEEE